MGFSVQSLDIPGNRDGIFLSCPTAQIFKFPFLSPLLNTSPRDSNLTNSQIINSPAHRPNFTAQLPPNPELNHLMITQDPLDSFVFAVGQTEC